MVCNRSLVLPIYATLFLVLSGCQGQGTAPYNGPYGSLTGKVTLDGKPVAERTMVIFTSKDGHAASATTDSSGSYDASKVPVTTYQVGITLPAMASDGSLPAGDPLKMGAVSIPTKYLNPETSGLSVTVGADEDKVFDLVLKSL